MSRAFRLVVLFLVAVALPIQGYAAVGMVACGSMHAQEAHHPASHAVSPEDGEDVAPSLPQPRKAACSACAACCTGTAVPLPALLAVGAQPTAPASPMFLELLGEGVILAGLERPPRSALH